MVARERRPAGPAGWQSGIIPVAGGHLGFHRTGGNGPPIVLSHGLTDNGLCWTRLAAALAPGFDIIMLDARGHGDSSRMSNDPPQGPGRDILEAVDHLGLRSPIVMGHSVGARATAEFAGANPGRASKVILEDPTFLPVLEAEAVAKRRLMFRRHVEGLQVLSDAEITATGRATHPDWHADEFPAWTAAKRQVDPGAMPDHRTPWQEAIARIIAPTLLIHGESGRGGVVTADLAEEARRLNPLLRSVEIPGAGHNIRRENFNDYLATVRSFLTAD